MAVSTHSLFWMGVSTSHLTALDERHHVHTDVVEAFRAMQNSARTQGIDLQLASSFRSFDRQLMIWNKKWRGELPLYDINGNELNPDDLSDHDKLHAILTWSALPGGSRHHWGTDVDVYDAAGCKAANVQLQLVPEEYEAGGPCYPLNQWLNIHMREYGFYRPYHKYNGGVAPEPWHLSHAPTAKVIEKALDLDVLAQQLSSCDILGKSVILQELPTLFERYTLNGKR
ncbi:M15 family metallopeptidase [Aestuariibacter sp. AA17]|uniref:M15 family metallopeptidase n=1 Tax=Fluctibacter corallii TaxID=2984329 RepID=A0ABT3A557_9ALTE|nr:M15 family metallopeptidase [Aestuariibacter sp. AA17]MCV2883774.1 M15 family metallopeptidase [Aestuariibacter sp. AA17]